MKPKIPSRDALMAEMAGLHRTGMGVVPAVRRVLAKYQLRRMPFPGERPGSSLKTSSPSRVPAARARDYGSKPS